MKCKMFRRTPSGEWPCDMVEDIFISESIKEYNREIAAAQKKKD
jgi:hypothetical protein